MREKKRLLVIIPMVLLLTLILLGLVAFFGLEYYATTAVKKEIDNHIQELSQHVIIKYDRLDVNWLAFTVNLHKVKLTKPPLPGIITIDKVSVRDVSSIGIKWIPTVVTFDHVVLTNERADLDLQHLSTTFTLNRIPSQQELAEDWTVFLDNLQSGEVHLRELAFADKKTQLQITTEKVDYGLDKGNPRQSNLTINGLTFQKEDLRFHLGDFLVDFSLNRENIPTHVTQQVKNFSFKFPPELAAHYPFFRQITSLGYDRLSLGFNLDYDYQPATKNVSIAWDASSANMGRVRIDLHLADFTAPPLPLKGGLVRYLAFFREMTTPPEHAGLRSLKVKYQDQGLVPRLLKAEAQSRQQSAEEFTHNLVGTINTTLLVLPVPASIKDQIKAVNRFLLDPQEIQLAITCKEPVRLENLEQGPLMGLVDLLGCSEVKITAK